ncbi:MAG TPA: tyrosine-type recombinase/integrase [Ktedonobacterales bacterium]|nr:tyrosine-type recombinase/integrase [Ktedonobacterales bacterium]
MPVERELAIPGARPGSPAARAVAGYLARLAPNSRRAVLTHLRAASIALAGPGGAVPWHALGYQRLTWLRDHLQAHGTSPRAINLTITFLRGVGAAAADAGLTAREAVDELQLVRGVAVPKRDQPPGRVVLPSQVAALFAVCWQDRSVAGMRDLALLHGIYWAGLSTIELASLRLDDYTPMPPSLRVEPARSARTRQVLLGSETAEVFYRWRATRGPLPGAFLVRLGRRGSLDGGRMSPSAITNVVRQRARHVGLAPLTPQDLRRTAIHEQIETGASLAEVHQRFGFVSQVTLAARYDHRDFTDARWRAWLAIDFPDLTLGAASTH